MLLPELVITDLAARAGDATARWLPLLLDGALKGTVILAAAAGATSLMRRGGAATRHLVWSAAVVGVLALPLLTPVVPRWSIAVAGLPAVVSMHVTSPTTSPTSTAVSTPAAPVDRAPTPAAVERVQRDVPDETAVDTPAPVPSRAPSLLGWLGIVWAAGALLVLLRLALGTVGLARLVRRAAPADDASWVMLLQRLARELGIRRPVTLLVGDTGTVPVTWGVVYPVVLLPADADAWSEERRRAVLLHELAHVERLDALTHVVSQLALALFWFHPLVALAVRRLRAERERACDDLVLAIGTRATSYADDLLELVQTLGEASPAAAALAMARRSEFEGRLLAILDPAVPRARTTRRAAVLASALAAVVLVPLAGAQLASTAARRDTTTVTPATRPPAAPAARAVAPLATPLATLTTPTVPLATATMALAASVTRLSEDGARLAAAVRMPGGCPPRAGRHLSIDNGGERSFMRLATEDHCVEVESVGQVGFTDDDADVASLSPNGVLSIAETRGGVTRQAMMRERGGAVERTYAVNGAASSPDAGAAWLRAMIPVLARESVSGVSRRVARIRRQQGVPGVLREIEQIGSDGVKRVWFAALLDGAPLSAGELQAAARVAGRAMTSDGDRRSVLSRLVTAPAVAEEVLLAAVQATATLTSDGDRASILRDVVARAAAYPAVCVAVADATRPMTSDGDRAGVLVAILRSSTEESVLTAVLRAARGMSSDGERSRVLQAVVARTTLSDPNVRAPFFAAVDGTSSDGDRAEVLLATLRRADLSLSALVVAMRSAGRVASDGEKARVLIAAASVPRVLSEPASREAFFDALKTMSSDSDYRRVMAAVTR